MAKRRFSFSLSRLLYGIGDALYFAPDSTFAPPFTAGDGKKTSPFLSQRIRFKSALAKMSEQSFFLTRLRSFLDRLFTTRIRSFGILFFTCGFLQIFSYFLRNYLPFLGATEENILFGVALLFLSLITSFSREDVGGVVKKSFLFRSVLSPLLGMQLRKPSVRRKHDHAVSMVLWGAILAVLSVWLTPFTVLFLTAVLVLIFVVFGCPEAGLFLIGLGFFTVPFSATALLTFLTLLSFFGKCAVGKRSFIFSLSDGIVLLCMLFLLFAPHGLVLFLVSASLYVLCLGLLRELLSISRLLGSMVVGGVFAALMICLREGVETLFPQFLLRFPELDRLFFVRPDAGFLLLLALLCPLARGLFRSFDNVAKHLTPPFVLLILFAGVFCGRNPGVWIVLLIALFVQNAMSSRPALLITVMLGILSVAAIQVIPPGILNWILALFGVGENGRGASGIFGFASMGIAFSALLLISMLSCFGWHCYRFAKSATRAEPYPQVLGALSAMIGLAVCGFAGVMTDTRVAVLLAMLSALPRAARICSKREEIYYPY